MNNIKMDLEYRVIERDGDTDYFIETLSCPIILEMKNILIPHIQFQKSRAVLVRTSPVSTRVTVHILKDIDLHSSFANFEVELFEKEMNIKKENGYIKINVINITLD